MHQFQKTNCFDSNSKANNFGSGIGLVVASVWGRAEWEGHTRLSPSTSWANKKRHPQSKKFWAKILGCGQRLFNAKTDMRYFRDSITCLIPEP
eukprot:4831938-Amphidinium_carterae.1